MIPQADLERAIARWKARTSGGAADGALDADPVEEPVDGSEYAIADDAEVIGADSSAIVEEVGYEDSGRS